MANDPQGPRSSCGDPRQMPENRSIHNARTENQQFTGGLAVAFRVTLTFMLTVTGTVTLTVTLTITLKLMAGHVNGHADAHANGHAIFSSSLDLLPGYDGSKRNARSREAQPTPQHVATPLDLSRMPERLARVCRTQNRRHATCKTCRQHREAGTGKAPRARPGSLPY